MNAFQLLGIRVSLVILTEFCGFTHSSLRDVRVSEGRNDGHINEKVLPRRDRHYLHVSRSTRVVGAEITRLNLDLETSPSELCCQVVPNAVMSSDGPAPTGANRGMYAKLIHSLSTKRAVTQTREDREPQMEPTDHLKLSVAHLLLEVVRRQQVKEVP